MKPGVWFITVVAAVGLAAPNAAFAAKAKIKKEKVQTRILEYPEVPVKAVDYATVRAELVVGPVKFGGKTQKTTKSICVPQGGGVKDAVEVDTYYYEVQYKTPLSILALKDQSGKPVYSVELAKPAVAVAEFGKDECKYHRAAKLEADFKGKEAGFRRHIAGDVTKGIQAEAERLVGDALFFNYAPEQFKLARVENGDYADLDEAFKLAKSAYAGFDAQGYNLKSREDLQKAIAIWEKALEETDLNDNKARINKKVAAALHENAAMAAMFVQDYTKAMLHLRKRDQLPVMSTSSSSGMGSADVAARARRRKIGYNWNRDIQSPEDIKKMMAASDPYRGKVALVRLKPDALGAMAAQHKAWIAEAGAEQLAIEKEEQEEAHASGAANKYEALVQHNALQGYFLTVTPLGPKLTELPPEMCDLQQLNTLLLDMHQIEKVPSEIKKLENLKTLSLAGNKIHSLPPEIGELHNLQKLNLARNEITEMPETLASLSNLKTLNLKNNNLSKDEQARIKKMLPKTKIKF